METKKCKQDSTSITYFEHSADVLLEKRNHKMQKNWRHKNSEKIAVSNSPESKRFGLSGADNYETNGPKRHKQAHNAPEYVDPLFRIFEINVHRQKCASKNNGQTT